MTSGDARIQDQISAGVFQLGQSLSDDAVDRLTCLLSELSRWGKRVNLTAILAPTDMVNAHVLDSLSARPLLEGSRILDVGTGAGFPGLPLAIAEPEREFELLDSNGKKIGFVRHIVGELGLDNVNAIKARAEDYAPGERFDTVIARALASVARLLNIAGHLVGEDGVLLALKGMHPTTELEEISTVPGWDHSVTEMTVPGMEQHQRHVVSLRRSEPRT